MDLKKSGFIGSENIYDLIVIGQGLQAALVVLHAAEKGLRAVLISENDPAENLNDAPFQIVGPIFDHHIFKIRSRNRLINSLKKSFTHLFIPSKTDNYQSLTIANQLVIIIHKYLFHLKVEIKKSANRGRFPYFSFQLYKFSSARITMSLLNKAVQKGAKIQSYSQVNMIEISDNQIYQIKCMDKLNHQEIYLMCKSVASFNLKIPILQIDAYKLAHKTAETLYFTYPASKIKLEKNRIFRTKFEELVLLIWFDLVYIEFSDSKSKKISLDDALIFIEKQFNDIQLDKSEIQAFGTFKKMLDKDNYDKVQLVYLNNNKQIEFRYKPINQWFNYSNHICNKIIKSINKGKKGKSPIGSIAFPGNDIPESDHPLRLLEFADEKYDQAKQILKSPVYFKKLFYRYGSEIDLITNKAYENWNSNKNSRQAWLKAEIWYAIEYEFCKKYKDFIRNRTEEWMDADQNNMQEIEQIFNELSN